MSSVAILDEGVLVGYGRTGNYFKRQVGRWACQYRASALEKESFLILPHPEVETYMQRKTGDYDRWIKGMNRLHLTMSVDQDGVQSNDYYNLVWRAGRLSGLSSVV